MNYPDSVEYLYSLGNETKVIKLGLEPVRALLRSLNNPQDTFRSIHVAGTNGKGSTCAMIESALRIAGIRTGLFTSPHLVQPTERIRIAGVEVTREQFSSAFNEVHTRAEALLQNGTLETHPSYFETVTAMAFVLFRQENVDTAVVEVGLGGRLDSTNVINPVVSVITPIDFDHEKYLGNTLESIASEKAGILKPGVPAVIAKQRPEADAVLLETAGRLHCPMHRTGNASSAQLTARGARFQLGNREFVIHLAGEHQVENALTAIATLDLLNVPANLEQARWPGRLEKVHDAPEIILDGAHNPAGARALKAYIEGFYQHRKVWIVFGAMRDKSVQEITELLFPLADHLILTAPDSPRAITPDSLLTITPHEHTQTTGSVPQAIQLALNAPPETAIFFSGSLYVVGEARALLVK